MMATTTVAAQGYVIGIGADGDSADGRAITAFGDFAIGDQTWLTTTAGSAQTEGIVQKYDTLYADIGMDHWFKPAGIRLGASYWGNKDVLDSRDFRASIYVRGGPGSVSVEYENRNFEFDLQSDLLRGRSVDFSANGWGVRARVELGERFSFMLGGVSYDYSRNVRLQPDIDALAFISRSRLSMINSLLDHRLNTGLEFRFGQKSLDVTAGRWQAAVDGSTVDSYSLGYLTPVSERVDMELRLALDESETSGRTTALSIYLYYFGGS